MDHPDSHTPYHRRFSDTSFHRMEFRVKYQNLYRVCGWNLLKQNMPGWFFSY